MGCKSEDVGILESNSFNVANIDSLEGDLKSLVERRTVLGPCYRLFYQKPLHLVRGKGTRLFDADGTEYLDMYNNIPSMGHSNPAITEAVTGQLQLLNTHTRYVHENILDYAEDLLSTMPEEIDRVMFMCSGSEANDLAVRCAQFYTGGEGIIVTGEAYHGNTALISGLSPSIGKSAAMSRTMRMIPSPDTFRLETDDLGAWMCEQISIQIQDMRRHGIADEVQPGFCRTGDAFWGFARHGIVPDIVTMGKPMANGIPCSAMAIKSKVLDAFAQDNPYFNTFAGNPVSMAAAQAVLNYIRENDILEHTRAMGEKIRAAVSDIATRHPELADVRGAGLFTGIEVVRPGTKEADRPFAVSLIEKLRENHVLISLCGPYGNVLKVRPPLVFDGSDLDMFASALEASLSQLEA